jgi:HEAT repeat protein
MNRALAVAIVAALAAAASAEEPPVPGVPKEAPKFWTEAEMAILDRGLDVLNCTRADLGFQKRPLEDPFRLAVVNRALDDPLSVGDEAQGWDDTARRGDPVALLKRACSQLDEDLRWPSSVEARSGSTPVPHLTGPSSSALMHLRRLGHGIAEMVEGGTVVISASGAPEESLPSLGKDKAPLLRKALLSQVEKPTWAIDAPDLTDARFLEQARAIDEGMYALRSCPGPLLVQMADLLKHLRMEGAFDRDWKGVERLGSPKGQIVIYGSGDDVHEADADALIVIDLGGNDTWTRGASASVLKNRAVSMCIDVSGNDRYVGREDLSFGGALGGVAIQWDGGGDDLYDAGHASLGAGICGVGILVDEGGDDVYRAKDFCIGAGAFGIGILLDKGGNDLYHGDLYAEGFASTRGCGVLADLDGNDVYDAGGVHLHAPLYTDRHQSLSQGFSIGMRPDASGGVGVLVDVKGNDRYTADIYGQGASYWYSLGILVDDDGNDTYNLGQYGQGSGIHLSAGILLDRAGSDLYYLKNGVGMGGAHDYAVGMLVDRGGDDYYAGSGGTQGGALTNSVALLFDMGGNDGYAAVNEGAQGYASPARGTGGIGLLMDVGGKDVYTERERDGAAWTKELLGAGLDEPEAAAAAGTGDPGVATITPEKAREAVDRDGTVPGPDGKPVDDLDRLWKLSCEWEVGDNRVIVPIARERLVALGRPALDRALEKVGDRQGLEYRNCEIVFAKFPAEEVVPRLVERTRDADMFVRRNSVRALASLQAKGALDRLAEMLEKDPETRSTVLGALAAMKTVPPSVKGFLRDPKESVGVQAVLCLASVGDEAAVAAMGGALGADHALPVRLAALDRLAAMGEAAVVPLTLLLEEEERPVAQRRNALRALGRTKSAAAVHPVVEALRSGDRGIRLSAFQAAGDLVRALGAEESKAVAEALAAARARETDDLVKRMR